MTERRIDGKFGVEEVRKNPMEGGESRESCQHISDVNLC